MKKITFVISEETFNKLENLKKINNCENFSETLELSISTSTKNCEQIKARKNNIPNPIISNIKKYLFTPIKFENKRFRLR